MIIKMSYVMNCFAIVSISALCSCGASTNNGSTLNDDVVDQPFGKWAIDSTSEMHGDLVLNPNGSGEDRILSSGSVIQSSKFSFTIDSTTTPKRMLHVYETSGKKVYCLFNRQSPALMKLNCSKTSYPASLNGGSTWHTY
ncbi:MAG: hypothetical protein NTV34_01955 [Proteobacteria bacterium]|nr:hypothetical protein [Pseudomonadota bacterium]